MSGPAGGAMIEFRGVSKTYPGSEKPVVNDLSFEVPDGEICVLVGPSGCGKTTSMRMVNRLIEITEGEILIDGETNTSLSGTQLRRKIGYAIQQIGLFPHRTIADNIGTVPTCSAGTRAVSGIAWTSFSSSSASLLTSTVTAIRPSSLEGSSSALASRGRWRRTPRSC